MRQAVVWTGMPLLVVMSGACHHRRTSADVRYRIFEVPQEIVDKVIPPERRTPIADSTYSIARATAGDLASLLDERVAYTGLLVDHSRRIWGWHLTADAWTYAKADAARLFGGGGTGGGCLSVRIRNAVREIRMEYDVGHAMNCRENIRSKVTYEGPAPDQGALIALGPFERMDGTQLVHLIAFETSNWRTDGSPARPVAVLRFFDVGDIARIIAARERNRKTATPPDEKAVNAAVVAYFNRRMREALPDVPARDIFPILGVGWMRLGVRATPEKHKEIEAFLDRLRGELWRSLPSTPTP